MASVKDSRGLDPSEFPCRGLHGAGERCL